MVYFGSNLFRAGGKHEAPQDIHAQDIGQHLGAVVPDKTGAVLEERRPKIIKTDEDHKRTEAFHQERRPPGQPFLPINRKNGPVFFHAVGNSSISKNARRMASVNLPWPKRSCSCGRDPSKSKRP